MRLLYLEDDPHDAELLTSYCAEQAPGCELVCVHSRGAFLLVLGSCQGVISDSGVYDLTGIEALKIARTRQPGIRFAFLCGAMTDRAKASLRLLGPDGVFSKDRPEEVADAVRLVSEIVPRQAP